MIEETPKQDCFEALKDVAETTLSGSEFQILEQQPEKLERRWLTVCIVSATRTSGQGYCCCWRECGHLVCCILFD